MLQEFLALRQTKPSWIFNKVSHHVEDHASLLQNWKHSDFKRKFCNVRICFGHQFPLQQFVTDPKSNYLYFFFLLKCLRCSSVPSRLQQFSFSKNFPSPFFFSSEKNSPFPCFSSPLQKIYFSSLKCSLWNANNQVFVCFISFGAAFLLILPCLPFYLCLERMIGQTEGVWALIENRYRQTFLTPPTGTEPQTLQHFISYLTQIILFFSSLYQNLCLEEVLPNTLQHSIFCKIF